MQEAQAHPSLVYHQHPHEQKLFSWEDGFLLAAVLTLSWVLWPFLRKVKKIHGMERKTRD